MFYLPIVMESEISVGTQGVTTLNISLNEGLENLVKIIEAVLLPISFKEDCVLYINLHVEQQMGSLQNMYYTYLTILGQASNNNSSSLKKYLSKIYLQKSIDIFFFIQEFISLCVGFL